MRPTKTIIGAIALAGALALTACQGGGGNPRTPSTPTPTRTTTPTSTPTPTPTVVSAPTTEEQALRDATTAVREFELAFEEGANIKSTDPSRLKSVSKGDALKFAQDFLAASVKDTTRYTGTSKVALKDGYASKLTIGGKKFEFGFADMSVCVDSTSVKGVLANGSPAPVADQRRVLYNFTAEFDPAGPKWFVTTITQSGVIPC